MQAAPVARCRAEPRSRALVRAIATLDDEFDRAAAADESSRTEYQATRASLKRELTDALAAERRTAATFEVMTVVVTDAIVLHAFDYLESSRIVSAGDARGRRAIGARARRAVVAEARFGAALDLYAQGTAELHIKPGRDLDTLSAFDVTRSRAAARRAARALHRRERDRRAHAALRARRRRSRVCSTPWSTALDELRLRRGDRARDVTLGGAWRILHELGVAPTIDDCAECHASIDADVAGDVQSSGRRRALCAVRAPRARRTHAAGRRARRASRLARGSAASDRRRQEARAHQRLLREFVREHLADDRPLRAFDAWEHDALGSRRAAGGAA